MRLIIIIVALLMVTPAVSQARVLDSMFPPTTEDYIQVTDKLVQLAAENRELKERRMTPLFFDMFKCFLRKHDWSDPSLGPVYCNRCGVGYEYWMRAKGKVVEPAEQDGDSGFEGKGVSFGVTPEPDDDKPGHGGHGHGHGHGRGHGKGHDKGKGRGHRR